MWSSRLVQGQVNLADVRRRLSVVAAVLREPAGGPYQSGYSEGVAFGGPGALQPSRRRPSTAPVPFA